MSRDYVAIELDLNEETARRFDEEKVVWPWPDFLGAWLYVREHYPDVVLIQQWNCGSCGARQTMGKAMLIWTNGRCAECGAITNLEQAGSFALGFGGPDRQKLLDTINDIP